MHPPHARDMGFGVRESGRGDGWIRLQHKQPAVSAQILQLEEGQDVAEYAVMLAVILAVVVGTIRMIGSGASNVFSSVASTIQ